MCLTRSRHRSRQKLGWKDATHCAAKPHGFFISRCANSWWVLQKTPFIIWLSFSVLWTKHCLQVLQQNLELSFIPVSTFTRKNEQGRLGTGRMSSGWPCLWPLLPMCQLAVVRVITRAGIWTEVLRCRRSVWAVYSPFLFVCFHQSYTLECWKIERLLRAVS